MLEHDVALNKGLRKQEGFALIDLLIIIGIIVIFFAVIAIAIPQFFRHKHIATQQFFRYKQANEYVYLDSVRMDVKNAVTVMESYNAENGKYPTLPIKTSTGPVSWSFSSNSQTKSETNNSSDVSLDVSTGDIVLITADRSCTDGYKVSVYNVNITSGSAGSQNNPVSYDSCKGQYSNF
jgi:hypothetical protein